MTMHMSVSASINACLLARLPDYSVCSVSTILAGAIPCTNIDPDGLIDGPDLYLRDDLSISCESDRYKYGVAWAAAFAVVYPIGGCALCA